MSIAFKPPRFYPILDTAVLAGAGYSIIQTADTLLAAGAKILQFRHKADWTQQNYDDAAKISELCQAAGVSFVINDRADYAQLLGAGLHVGQEDLPPVAARRILPDAVIGFSTHNRRQLIRAQEEQVEYFSFGPIFATASKANPDPVVGVDGLRAIRMLTKKPLVAIGGITCDNAAAVLEAGADSVAVISGLLPAKGPRALPKHLRDWLSLTN